jgi:hypothetical protein
MSVEASDGRQHVMTEDILRFIGESDCPVVTSGKLADEFDFTQQAAYERLQKLHEQDILGKMKVGGRAVVWWINDDY